VVRYEPHQSRLMAWFNLPKQLKIFHHRGTESTEKSIVIVNNAAGAVNKVKLCALCALCASVVKCFLFLSVRSSLGD
jgi:hypothetical protein